MPSDMISWAVDSTTSSGEFARGTRYSRYPAGALEGASKGAMILHLEHKLQIAEEQKVHQEQAHKRREKQLRTEITRLGSLVSDELTKLQDRQEALEATSPALRAELASARAQLRDVDISETMYHELLRVPRDELPLADAVRIAVYEAVRDVRAENERLRKTSTADRATAKAMEEECHTLRHGVSMAENRAAQREREASEEAELLQRRVDRLDHQLREATVRAELLSSKATMYDSLTEEANELREKVTRLEKDAGDVAVASGQNASLRAELATLNHQNELLLHEADHVRRRADFLDTEIEHLRHTLNAREARIEELETNRDELLHRLMKEQGDNRITYDERLRADLARVREESQREVAKIRDELERGFHREVNLIKDLKAEADKDAEVERDRAERLARSLEEERASHLAAAKEASVKESTLLGRLEMLMLERTQASTSTEELTARLVKAQKEADKYSTELRMTKEAMSSLDATCARRLADVTAKLDATREKLNHYEMIENNLDRAILNAAGSEQVGQLPSVDYSGDVVSSSPLTVIKALEGAVPMAMKRRVKQALALAARCTELEASKTKVEADLEAAKERVRELEADVLLTRNRLKRVHQPQTYVLDEVDRLEGRAVLAEKQATRLAHELAQSEREREALRRDLFVLLEEQGSLDELQTTLEALAVA